MRGEGKIHIGRKNTGTPFCNSKTQGLDIRTPGKPDPIEKIIETTTCTVCLDKIVESITSPPARICALKRARELRAIVKYPPVSHMAFSTLKSAWCKRLIRPSDSMISSGKSPNPAYCKCAVSGCLTSLHCQVELPHLFHR